MGQQRLWCQGRGARDGAAEAMVPGKGAPSPQSEVQFGLANL